MKQLSWSTQGPAYPNLCSFLLPQVPGFLSNYYRPKPSRFLLDHISSLRPLFSNEADQAVVKYSSCAGQPLGVTPQSEDAPNRSWGKRHLMLDLAQPWAEKLQGRIRRPDPHYLKSHRDITAHGSSSESWVKDLPEILWSRVSPQLTPGINKHSRPRVRKL